MDAQGTDSASGFERVFAYLRERLLDGTLKQGERLMAERELAAQLGVSRPIVREALRALHMLGIVEIRERVGTIVKRPDASMLKDFFTLALAQQADLIDDVMEARIAIECQALRARHHRRFRAAATRARPHRRDHRRCGCWRRRRFRVSPGHRAGLAFADARRAA
jgi:DNA-binding FadR family transcriptional regulator